MQILSSHLGTPWSDKNVINKLLSILLKALEKSTKARRIEWGRLFGRSPFLYMNSKSLYFVTPYLSPSFLANPATPMLLILCKTSFGIFWQIVVVVSKRAKSSGSFKTCYVHIKWLRYLKYLQESVPLHIRYMG